MQYPLCRHIKTNGSRCQSPSLSGGVWCYFHNRLHKSHSHYRNTGDSRNYLIPGQHLELNTLEDAESIQVALSLVINALATGHLEARRASALLYGLQLASRNTGRIQAEPNPPDVVRSVISSSDGHDLAQPGATLEINEPDNGEEKRAKEGKN